jgi:5-formyltetrahydrofolate cyclo-ligase
VKPITFNKKNTEIRNKMRAKREALSSDQVRNAAASISHNLWQLPEIQRAKKIGCYIDVNGEASSVNFVQTAFTRKKRIFVPVLHKKNMAFFQLFPNSKLKNNEFGIPEPPSIEQNLITPQSLNIILIPLVAFDLSGNRLGMGGGYYDKLLSFTKRRNKYRRPLIIGMAYNFQQVNQITANNWDVPMHIVTTETKIYRFA